MDSLRSYSVSLSSTTSNAFSKPFSVLIASVNFFVLSMSFFKAAGRDPTYSLSKSRKASLSSCLAWIFNRNEVSLSLSLAFAFSRTKATVALLRLLCVSLPSLNAAVSKFLTTRFIAFVLAGVGTPSG